MGEGHPPAARIVSALVESFPGPKKHARAFAIRVSPISAFFSKKAAPILPSRLFCACLLFKYDCAIVAHGATACSSADELYSFCLSLRIIIIHKTRSRRRVPALHENACCWLSSAEGETISICPKKSGFRFIQRDETPSTPTSPSISSCFPAEHVPAVNLESSVKQ